LQEADDAAKKKKKKKKGALLKQLKVHKAASRGPAGLAEAKGLCASMCVCLCVHVSTCVRACVCLSVCGVCVFSVDMATMDMTKVDITGGATSPSPPLTVTLVTKVGTIKQVGTPKAPPLTVTPTTNYQVGTPKVDMATMDMTKPPTTKAPPQAIYCTQNVVQNTA